jgi:hypothetical protein
MASLNSLKMRSLAAQTTGIRVVEDTSLALRISHIGASAVTSVTIAAGTIVLIDGETGTLTCTYASESTTVGALADRINATASWRCKFLDCLRTQTLAVASTLIPVAALTANSRDGEIGYDVYLDTTVAFTFAIRATYDRTARGLAPKGGHRIKLVNFEYVLDVDSAAADKVQIWEWDPVLRTETQIWQALSVDSTTTATSFDFSKAPMAAKEGNDLIVLVTDATAITNAATNYLQVLYTKE